MIHLRTFDYVPNDEEREKASNSYVMSLIAVMIGMPLPIINLIATLAFYLTQRRSTHFIRWHSTQALLSQFSLLLMNSAGFIWALNVFLGQHEITNSFIAYILTVALYNLGELIATIYTAVNVRRGHHVEWYFYSTLTDEICSE